jgi:NitT/TauT family transport system substrate-binding protein
MTVRAAVACLLLVVLVAPTGGAATGPTRQDEKLESVTVVTLAVEPAGLVFYAKQRGFFTRQGLDVKVQIVSDPATIVPALLSGDAQFIGFNVGGAAVAKSRNLPIRLIAAGAMYQRSAPGTGLMAAPGKRITRARDLVGKTIAIDRAGTIAHVGLLKWLKGNGVSADDVHLVEMGGFQEMLGPLRRGQVDAALMPEPYLTIALQSGAKRIANPFHAVCAQDCLITTWMTRKDTDPVLAARFRNAIQAAAVWADKPENDAASAAIIRKDVVPISAKVIAKMTRTRFATRLRPAQAQAWIDAFAEFKFIPQSFRAIDLVK